MSARELRTRRSRQLLREYCERYGWRIVDLARMLDVSVHRARELRCGRCTLTPEELARLGDAGHSLLETLRREVRTAG